MVDKDEKMDTLDPNDTPLVEKIDRTMTSHNDAFSNSCIINMQAELLPMMDAQLKCKTIATVLFLNRPHSSDSTLRESH